MKSNIKTKKIEKIRATLKKTQQFVFTSSDPFVVTKFLTYHLEVYTVPFYLTFFLACYLASILAFYLASILTFYGKGGGEEEEEEKGGRRSCTFVAIWRPSPSHGRWGKMAT